MLSSRMSMPLLSLMLNPAYCAGAAGHRPCISQQYAYIFFQTLHVHDLLGLWLYTYMLDGKTLTHTLKINFHKDFHSASMMLKLTQTGGDTY